MQRLNLEIDGMGCGACVRKVTSALGSVSGVRIEEVKFGQATVCIDPQATSAQNVLAALQKAGYTTRKVS